MVKLPLWLRFNILINTIIRSKMKHIKNGDYDRQCKDVQVVEISAHQV